MTNTDEAILTFAEAFCRLGDRKYQDLYVEALTSIVRMAKAEERHASQPGLDSNEDLFIHDRIAPQPLVLH
jgi:hypothetical protein